MGIPWTPTWLRPILGGRLGPGPRGGCPFAPGSNHNVHEDALSSALLEATASMSGEGDDMVCAHQFGSELAVLGRSGRPLGRLYPNLPIYSFSIDEQPHPRRRPEGVRTGTGIPSVRGDVLYNGREPQAQYINSICALT